MSVERRGPAICNVSNVRQRRPLFELGRVMRPHHSAQTAEVAEVKPRKPKFSPRSSSTRRLFSSLISTCSLANSSRSRLFHCSNQPVMTFVGVDQDHQVVSEPRIFDIGVLAVACDFPRSFQHFVNLIEVEDY